MKIVLRRLSLEHAWGFTKLSDVPINEFTVLVGPNNGGKTTLLRAIQFATIAFRLYFGEGHEADLNKISNGQWICEIDDLSRRMGIADLTQFYHGRSRHRSSITTLFFKTEDDKDITLTVTCPEANKSVAIEVHSGGQSLATRRGVGDDIIKAIHAFRVLFVPPLGTLSPTEDELSYPNLLQRLAQGQYSETWRNQLQWLNDGQRPESFQRVVNIIREYLGDITVNPPRRTREQTPPHVVVEYREGDVDYDISSGGGGLRTLLSLATAIELSHASLLLFDEPDAHLHSSLQRLVARLLRDLTSSRRQIIVSTHAPDVIDEVPVESLRWVDRSNNSVSICDDVGKTLVRLGAISQSQAIQSLGADVLLYFEGKPDKAVLAALMRRCGKEQLILRSRQAMLKGFGDIENLPGALRMLKALLPMAIAVVAIRDADYTEIDPQVACDESDDLLIIKLPCKELENLLLCTPDTIADAAKTAAQSRQSYVGTPCAAPSVEEVEEKIVEYSASPEVKDAIENQWIFQWLKQLGGLTGPERLIEARREFQNRWATLAWRRRCCSGKLILTRLRQWLQAEPWKLSISTSQLFAAYQPSDEIRGLFDILDKYVARIRH